MTRSGHSMILVGFYGLALIHPTDLHLVVARDAVCRSLLFQASTAIHRPTRKPPRGSI